jgi:hypothetical protein
MNAHLSADEQRKIRAELDEIGRILEKIRTRLAPLDPSDDRVSRTECVLASLKRLYWSMSNGSGRLALPVKIESVLRPN